MTIVLRALRLSDTRIETLSCSRQLTSKDELNGPTGCHINHINTSFYPMNAFQHLQTLDLVVALRPLKRCTYLRNSHRLCILTLLSRSIYGDSVYNLLARTETAYVTLHSIRQRTTVRNCHRPSSNRISDADTNAISVRDGLCQRHTVRLPYNSFCTTEQATLTFPSCLRGPPGRPLAHVI